MLAAVLEQGFAVDPSFLDDRSKSKNISEISSNAIKIEYNGHDGHGDKYVIYSLSTDSSLLNDNAAGEDHKCLIM